MPLPLCFLTSFIALLCVTLRTQAFAYEVDNFTGRDRPVSDSLPILDERVNRILSKAAASSNKDSSFRCNRVQLRSNVLSWVRPDPVSFLELWATFTGAIERIEVPKSKSVYAGAELSESPAVWFAGIGQSFKLNGKIIGTDKLGHFFMQGFGYFKEVESGKRIEDVIRADHGEDGFFGLATSGVLSYADMAANYAGYKFWKELYAGADPYFRCKNDKRWVQVRQFSWKDHVTDAWDEAINCNVMKPSLEERVEGNLKKVGVTCPISAAKCSELAGHEFAEVLISPACLAASQSKIRTTISAPER